VADEIDSITVAGSPDHEDPVRQVLLDQESMPDPTGSVVLRRFDLGRIAAGSVTLEVAGADPGTRVDVAASEHVDAHGRLVTLGQHAGFRYVCRGDDDVFTTFDTIGTRFLNVAVRGADASVSNAQIRLSVTDRHRPRPAGASFECSDD
jgi:hypothetical protein